MFTSSLPEVPFCASMSSWKKDVPFFNVGFKFEVLLLTGSPDLDILSNSSKLLGDCCEFSLDLKVSSLMNFIDLDRPESSEASLSPSISLLGILSSSDPELDRKSVV